MDYKTKALDHVRSVCPELMELSFGCKGIGGGLNREIRYHRYDLDKSEYGRGAYGHFWTYDDGNGFTFTTDNRGIEIIGHTPHLEHLLKCVDKKHWGTLLDLFDLDERVEEQSDDFFLTFLNLCGVST